MIVRGFDFPDDLLVHVEHQVWARLHEDGTATVGITSMGVHLAGGEIYLCRPKSLGQVIEQGRGVAIVELAKSVVSMKSPLAGEVVAVNERLGAEPELVHVDPYGAGWVARLRLSALEADRGVLVQGEAGRAAIERHAALNLVEGA